MRGVGRRQRRGQQTLPVVRWLQVGVVTAGVGLALSAAPAIAAADDGADSAVKSSASPAGPATKAHRSSAASTHLGSAPTGGKVVSGGVAVASRKPVRAAVSEVRGARVRSSVTAAAAADTASRLPAAHPAAGRARAAEVPAASATTVDSALGNVAAFFGLPGAPATSAPTLSAVPMMIRLQLDDWFGGSVPTQPMDPTTVITGLFRQVLREDPDATELQNYTAVWNAFGLNGVVAGLYSSTQFRQTQVTNYYLELLGRTPTSSELAWDTSKLIWGMPEPVLAAQIASSPEFYSDSSGGEVPGYGPSATTFVKLLYRAMAGQAADPTAAPVYIQQLQAGLPAPLVSLQFVTSDTFRAAKIQEIYQVALGEAATTDQISQYESRWYFDGGLAGIATTLLASAANIDRIEAGQVTLPDMQAAAQLQQLLLANYTSDPDGFVKLMNTLLNASEASPCSATSATCNTALYNLLTSGGSDRGFPNSALQVAGMTANVGSLIPTQNEIDMSKSLVYPLTDHTTLDTYFAGGTILPPGGVILTADDGTFIVDGHHRWSAIFVINPNAQVSTVDMGYVPNPQEALKEAQIGVVAQTGYLKTATTSGANLYTVDQAVFYATVNDYILNGTTKNPPDTVEVLKTFTKYLGLDGQTQEQKLASIDAYLWGNVLRMRQYNQPIPDATSRDVMPQVEPLTPILNYLQSGALSYTFPTIAYLG